MEMLYEKHAERDLRENLHETRKLSEKPGVLLVHNSPPPQDLIGKELGTL
jgi:hypothetical protein